MTPKILGSDYATRIRARLGVTSSHLTDPEIDEVLPEIEAVYCEKITDYASKTGDIKLYLDSSVVCMTAAGLCSVLKKKYPVREQGPSGSFETPIDWDSEESKLRVKANEFLSKVKAPTVYSPFKVINSA
jgi:hypothetical protein